MSACEDTNFAIKIQQKLPSLNQRTVPMAISVAATPSIIIRRNTSLALKSQCQLNQRSGAYIATKPLPSAVLFHPLRVVALGRRVMWREQRMRRCGAVCYSPTLTTQSIQWICTISTAVLALVHGTGIQKAFLVPILALQAPYTVVSWIKGEYGMWTAFLALLVRLFFFIPGELELPLAAFLILAVAPYEILKFRGTQEGTVLSLVIAGYLAFQHFTGIGSLKKAFEQGSIVATVSIVCICVMSCLLLL